jgi:hypothetical protein
MTRFSNSLLPLLILTGRESRCHHNQLAASRCQTWYCRDEYLDEITVMKQLADQNFVGVQDEDAAYYRISDTRLASLDGEAPAVQLLFSGEDSNQFG